jgi:hypothetical protein
MWRHSIPDFRQKEFQSWNRVLTVTTPPNPFLFDVTMMRLRIVLPRLLGILDHLSGVGVDDVVAKISPLFGSCLIQIINCLPRPLGSSSGFEYLAADSSVLGNRLFWKVSLFE